jgi:hypothetical protein
MPKTSEPVRYGRSCTGLVRTEALLGSVCGYDNVERVIVWDTFDQCPRGTIGI